MNFFQRALKNVTRKPSKSILLLLTFFVIGNFVIVGLGVSKASEDAKVLTRQKMRAVVTVEIDYDAVYEYTNTLEDEDEINEFYDNYPRVTYEDMHLLLKDPRVKTANAISIYQYYKSEDIDYVHLNNEAEMNMGGGENCWVDESGQQTCYTYIEPSFSVKANYFPDMIEFADGAYTIVDGRFYDQEEIDNYENVMLISNALAEENGLRVGDSISFYTSNPGELEHYLADYGIVEEDIYAEFEIIGIFDHDSKITPDHERFDWMYPYENPDNLLFVPATTLNAIQVNVDQKYFDYYASMYPDDEYYNDESNRPSVDNMENIYLNGSTLLLNDPLEVDQFVEDYNGSLGQYKILNANNEEFERLSRPLDTLSLYANFIVCLVVINAVIITTLVTALTLKTREYEIGVLLSIGASKVKIVAQFFVELALVAILGFSLSIVSGSMIANKAGATILDYQIQSSGVAEEEDDFYSYDSIWNTNYATDISLDDLLNEYNVSVSPVIIAEIYVVGLGIVLVSILIPSMMIMRFNPKRILMNQY